MLSIGSWVIWVGSIGDKFRNTNLFHGYMNKYPVFASFAFSECIIMEGSEFITPLLWKYVL